MRRRLLSVRTLLVATAAALAAGGVGIATGAIPDGNGAFTVCVLKNVGTVRLIDRSLPASSGLSHCTSLEREVTWNQQGLAGTNGTDGKDGLNGTDGTDGHDGVSVTTAPEPAGPNCANGGSKLTSAGGASYVCNGEDGSDGKDGSNGAPWDIVQHRFSALAPGVSSVLVAPCPVGDIVLGGTFDQTESSTLTFTSSSGRGRGERVALCRLQQSDGVGNSLSHHHAYVLRQRLTSTGDRTPILAARLW